MRSILVKVFIAGLVFIQSSPLWPADETEPSTAAAPPGGVWWDWNVKREWSSTHRRSQPVRSW
jgi:hypothetical protein